MTIDEILAELNQRMHKAKSLDPWVIDTIANKLRELEAKVKAADDLYEAITNCDSELRRHQAATDYRNAGKGNP